MPGEREGQCVIFNKAAAAAATVVGKLFVLSFVLASLIIIIIIIIITIDASVFNNFYIICIPFLFYVSTITQEL